jgi:hypothetical protein
MKNVLLVARFDEARNAHAGLVQRALERLGCTVTALNLEKTGWLDRLSRKDMNSRLEQAMAHARPELVLLTDGEVLREGAVEANRRQGGARWVHWFPTPDHDGSHIPLAVRHSDMVFVAGQTLARHWSMKVGSAVHSLDAACDPSIHRPLRVKDPFRANVVFAGTASSYRQGVLEQLVEFGLAIWGPGWKKTALKEYCRGELISAENFVRAYAGATLAINLHREAQGAPPDGACHRRVFEVAAIGVPQLVDARRELADHFAVGEEVMVWNGIEELRARVRQLLSDSHQRDAMSSAARQTAMKRHTYMHRCRTLLDEIGGKGR